MDTQERVVSRRNHLAADPFLDNESSFSPRQQALLKGAASGFKSSSYKEHALSSKSQRQRAAVGCHAAKPPKIRALASRWVKPKHKPTAKAGPIKLSMGAGGSLSHVGKSSLAPRPPEDEPPPSMTPRMSLNLENSHRKLSTTNWTMSMDSTSPRVLALEDEEGQSPRTRAGAGISAPKFNPDQKAAQRKDHRILKSHSLDSKLKGYQDTRLTLDKLAAATGVRKDSVADAAKTTIGEKCEIFSPEENSWVNGKVIAVKVR